jgi:phosphoribosylformylglycinamidine synthase
MKRLFVEKKPAFRSEAEGLLRDLRDSLRLTCLQGLRILQRYDVEGASEEAIRQAIPTVFAEPPVDDVHLESFPLAAGEVAFAVEFLPGQFDQRADSAAQCLQIVGGGERPVVGAARTFVVSGASADDLKRIKAYLINPVDSREADLAKPSSLRRAAPVPAAVAALKGFLTHSPDELVALRKSLGLAMSDADLVFCQKHFCDEAHREPTLTEIKLLDTYWSDHCRHTTFLAELKSVEFAPSPLLAPFKAAWDRYQQVRLGLNRQGKPVCLMDIATIAGRELKRTGHLDDMEDSEEVNAASIVVPVEIDGKVEEWLVMFKNETHNHPTEIEPFGGAATCLGGAIRDPLSGRSYVYQAMRVTGAGNPLTPYEQTLPGKLPQRKITTGAAAGYSAYGNQIGLATGLVSEHYHPGYVAKRMEIGAVVAAGPRACVRREAPVPGDVIVLVGGRTGRDGVGGATGSSKEHTETALQNSAEVQKGDAPTERKLQRLFRDAAVSKLIKRCNDFGAGGVSVAIGELAPALHIHLDRVPLKYDGLDGSEIALSESQERMAVVLEPKDVAAFLAAAHRENLEAVHVADVTDSGRLIMEWRGQRVVDIARDFLDTNGVTQTATASVTAPDAAKHPFQTPAGAVSGADLTEALSDLPNAAQRGMVERFDASIGSNTVLHPFGGATQSTPQEAMAAKLPVLSGETDVCTIMAYGFNPEVAQWSPGHGAVCAVVESLARLTAAGGNPARARLTLQEYFEKLGGQPTRWGKPLVALLGALDAQLEFGTAAIGGKDSMSGSFKELDVPPTLVSFAIVPGKASQVVSAEFKHAGSTVVIVDVPRTSALLPDLKIARERFAAVHALMKSGKVLAATAVRQGGVGHALARMTFGNRLGVSLTDAPAADFLIPAYGSLVLEVAAAADLGSLPHRVLGQTTAAATIAWPGTSLSVDALLTKHEAVLESVFPTKASEPLGVPAPISFTVRAGLKPKLRVAKPRVIIPVFPGSNCEYDTARAFRLAGAEPEILVLRNLDAAGLAESLKAFAEAISRSQILMIPGGFSAGDEPDGSGKFIAAVIKSPVVRDATMELLKSRDGLVLGICNGFQALIKTGLVPFGEIRDVDASAPTLFHNRIARHISRYAHTRIASVKSPWLARMEVGQVHTIPLSHGEGRFTAPAAVIADLVKNGQVAFQYCDAAGAPSNAIEFNPNGSLEAIEGITSPCGRVLGKMGHSERTGANVAKNIPGNKHQPLFQGGVDYFA